MMSRDNETWQMKPSEKCILLLNGSFLPSFSSLQPQNITSRAVEARFDESGSQPQVGRLKKLCTPVEKGWAKSSNPGFTVRRVTTDACNETGRGKKTLLSSSLTFGPAN